MFTLLFGFKDLALAIGLSSHRLNRISEPLSPSSPSGVPILILLFLMQSGSPHRVLSFIFTPESLP